MLAQNYKFSQDQLVEAALVCGRDPRDVRLLAVSKQQSVERIEALWKLGQRRFGENYCQEALPKIELLRSLPLEWHFIGQVQSNKTKDIAFHFDWVHSVDRLSIAKRLSDQRPSSLARLNVCIAVDLCDETQKSGVLLEEVDVLARELVRLPRIRLSGLMTMPRLGLSEEESLDVFQRLHKVYAHLNSLGYDLDTLSMGTSHDFTTAVRAGSTLVRLGTALFGSRHHV